MELSQSEELLREAAYYGDLEAIKKLISTGTNVNSQHSVNGWTPLHWACKRGQFDAATLLLSNGADTSLMNNESKTAKDITTSSQIFNIFSAEANDVPFLEADPMDNSPFTPSYLVNMPVNYKVNLNTHKPTQTEKFQQDSSTSPLRKQSTHLVSMDVYNEKNPSKDILLRLRIADTNDPDFIEIELAVGELTYGSFLATCANELNMNPQMVERVRKLPNIRLRNDMDIKRLRHLDYLEFVVKGRSKCVNTASFNSQKPISTFQNQTILY